MAFATISMTNGEEIKLVPLGYSWTTLFFGFFPAFFREDFIIGCVMLVLSIFALPVTWIVFSFVYNKMYYKSLVSKGYKIWSIPDNITEDQISARLGIINLPMYTK